MDYTKPSRAIHICQSPDCGCGITRRDFLRLSAQEIPQIGRAHV